MIEFKINALATAMDLRNACDKLWAMADGMARLEGVEVNNGRETSIGVNTTVTTLASDTTHTPSEEHKAGAAKDQAKKAEAFAKQKAAEKAANNSKPAGGSAANNSLNYDELDADGAPYDPEIHAGTRGKTAKDTWKMGRGVDKELYKTRTAENIKFAAALGGEFEEDFDEDEQDPEEVFGAQQDPEEVFGAQQGTQSETVADVLDEAETAMVEEELTPKSLMARAVSHLTAGRLEAPEIHGILKANPGMDGNPAPHLGALDNPMFAGCLEPIRDAFVANLQMKGETW